MGCRETGRDMVSSITPLGSPVLCLHPECAPDILVGVGLGCLLQMTTSQPVVKVRLPQQGGRARWVRLAAGPQCHSTSLSFSPQLEPDSLLVWILAGALGLSLVFSFVSVPVQCFQLGKSYGICLILYYLAFLCVALLTEFRVIHLSTI